MLISFYSVLQDTFCSPASWTEKTYNDGVAGHQINTIVGITYSVTGQHGRRRLPHHSDVQTVRYCGPSSPVARPGRPHKTLEMDRQLLADVHTRRIRGQTPNETTTNDDLKYHLKTRLMSSRSSSIICKISVTHESSLTVS